MAGNLQQIKRRMNSIGSTMKITKAMKLVATVKLQTWKKKLVQTQDYTNSVELLISRVLKEITDFDSIYLKENKNTSKDLYILVTSSVGLCAGYNNEVFRFVDEKIKKEDELIVLGLKGVSYYASKEMLIDNSYQDLSNHVDYKNVESLGRDLLEKFKSLEYRNVYLVYTSYKNSITFLPQMKTLLPIAVKKEDSLNGYGPIIEPDAETLVEALIPMYVNTIIYGKIIESTVSEHASRMMAMENATDNANELNQSLLLEFNKQRQAQITQEITEIIAGSNK